MQDPYSVPRYQMVENLKKAGCIKTVEVERAMKKVPRHIFLQEYQWNNAYRDSPQLIACNQTISAPHMNAIMCECLSIHNGQHILEIGTGSGYHAALLSELVGPEGFVISIERHQILAERVIELFSLMNINNTKIIIGDGSLGYEEYAPFDRILVTAASPTIPPPLLQQLSSNDGLLCIPIGNELTHQKLLLIKNKENNLSQTEISNVIFVPLIGKFGFPNQKIS